MNFPQIIAKVYSQPWCITPAKHRAIQRVLEARILGARMDLPLDEGLGDEVKPESYSAGGGVQVIPIHGIIGKHLSMMEAMCGGCSLDAISAQLEMAAVDDKVQAVLLDINSPGGTVTGVPEVAQQIAAMSKPVAAFTDCECCSAAYWLASQANSGIYATQSATVGSVGVYMALLDESRALENEGLKVNAITAGKFKLAGAPFKPLTEEERAMFQAGVNKIYGQFKAAILGTGRALDDDKMQGQVFDGDDAAAIGMVDACVLHLGEVLEKLTPPPTVAT